MCEDQDEHIRTLETIIETIDDILVCNWISIPQEWSPELYRKAIHELCCGEQKIGIHFEHQRLIKLNEDFYGPAYPEDDEDPFKETK